MENYQRLLEWCQRERELSQGIVDDIKNGARHFTRLVGGSRRENTNDLRVREAATVAYLDKFIAELKAFLEMR